jgi:hypothetical protein
MGLRTTIHESTSFQNECAELIDVFMEVKRFKGIDYDFRPKSYWDLSDPLQAILKNVKGSSGGK